LSRRSSRGWRGRLRLVVIIVARARRWRCGHGSWAWRWQGWDRLEVRDGRFARPHATNIRAQSTRQTEYQEQGASDEPQVVVGKSKSQEIHKLILYK